MREARIIVLLREGEKERFEEAAERAGLSASGWLRAVGLAALAAAQAQPSNQAPQPGQRTG